MASTGAKSKNNSSEDKSKKGKNIFSLVILLLALVNLGAVGAIGYFMKSMWDHVEKLQTMVINVREIAAVQQTPSVGKELQPKELGVLFPLESFLVNLPASGGPKFLQAEMELELEDPDVEVEITRKKAALRDSIIVLLSSLSYKEVRQPGGLKKLREDILRTINNNLLTTGRVSNVYFTRFHFN